MLNKNEQLQLDVFAKSLEYYDKNFVAKNKPPHARDWQPGRYAVRDVILGFCF